MSALVAAEFLGLAVIVAIAVATWVVSVVKHDVSIVDSVWSALIFGAGAAYAARLGIDGPRATAVLAVAAVWALRLCLYITWRNHGAPEDLRYQEIRARNEPNFAVKSLYLVFLLQGVLAWIVSASLLAAIASTAPLNLLDYLGFGLAIFGVAFESIADAQLARFRRTANRARVLDTGLWRYTRHPNYFGEFCVWWGFYLVALAAGGWWAILSPLLMSVLLLKVSGVALLEKDIGKRHPDYRDYVARTNAFFPGLPRAATKVHG